MRIIAVTVGTLFVAVILFFIVKLWGQGQTFAEFKHPMLELKSSDPVTFVKPNSDSFLNIFENESFLYLDLAVTEEQILVILKKSREKSEKPFRYSKYDEIRDEVIVLQDFSDQLKSKKIIFNLVESAQAIHEIFDKTMKETGLADKKNFIVISPYEASLKALKEIAPAFIYGSSQPEILRLVAMRSMFLIEATTFRADVVIHPLYIHNQIFFTEDLQQEIKRRYKKFIIGPLESSEVPEALKLNPYGIIVKK